MQFHVLGPLEVVVGGRPLPLSGFNQRATLAFLLLRPNQVVAMSELRKALWGDDPPATARKMLQNAISGLRSTLLSSPAQAHSAVILTRAPGYELRVDLESIDFCRFQRLVQAAMNRTQDAHTACLLRQALALWRGPALTDLAEYGIDWPELAVVQNARLTALENLVDVELNAGRHHEVVGELERTVAQMDTPREGLCGQLMLALYRCGRQADALSVYRRARTAMVERLGLEPGRALQMLERAILDHDPWLSSPTTQHGRQVAAADPTSRTPSADVVTFDISTVQRPRPCDTVVA